MEKKKVKVYTVADRVWHWIHGISIFLLALTGAEVHFPGFKILPYKTAVKAHMIFGYIVIFDYFFWLLHMFLYGYIRHYFYWTKNFGGIFKQIRYYVYGIFVGEKNPFVPSEKYRLNPLQALAYLGLMFILVPIQGFTGYLLLNPVKHEGIIRALGGLNIVAEIHTIVAYLIVAFLIGHLYLATTGVTVFADYKAMITGWAEE